MSNTLRKVIEFPRYMREMSAKIDPLDQELEVMRAVNWELNKLPNDESVTRCMQFLMLHRGYDLGEPKETD